MLGIVGSVLVVRGFVVVLSGRVGLGCFVGSWCVCSCGLVVYCW